MSNVRRKKSMHEPQRGAALIAALLLALVLSAMGYVAVSGSVSGLSKAREHRIEHQARRASDAAMSLVSHRIGNKATLYWRALEQGLQQQNALTMNNDERIARNGHGGFLRIDEASFAQVVGNQAGPETGLFATRANDGFSSHESEPTMGESDFQLIVRDPLEGPLATGYGDEFCFKRVYISSRYTYNIDELNSTVDQIDWGRAPSTGTGRHGFEALIGPMRCNE
ncbi:MAG: hypothetical protein AAGI01_02100 [Myxococcota bacterium]